jgi:glycine betaine/proline transport system permease protein
MNIENGHIPIGGAIDALVEFLLNHFQPLFDVITTGIGSLTDALASALLWVPGWILTLLLAALAWARVGRRFGLFTLASLSLLEGMNLWPESINTLALVLAATVVSLTIGLPLGIWAARRDAVDRLIRPVLDFMQTMPAFVYLIPAAMFFGLGRVPGVIATIIFSMPPAVRLTNLGIRQVPKELVEAGQAFGCTPMQLLFKVQIPTAKKSIMAGINQNIMLALSMVVIASMIGAGGLGKEVLRGIQRLEVGVGFEGGIGVVLLAIILDRITQSFGDTHHRTITQRLKTLFTRNTDSQ